MRLLENLFEIRAILSKGWWILELAQFRQHLQLPSFEGVAGEDVQRSFCFIIEIVVSIGWQCRQEDMFHRGAHWVLILREFVRAIDQTHSNRSHLSSHFRRSGQLYCKESAFSNCRATLCH